MDGNNTVRDRARGNRGRQRKGNRNREFLQLARRAGFYRMIGRIPVVGKSTRYSRVSFEDREVSREDSYRGDYRGFRKRYALTLGRHFLR